MSHISALDSQPQRLQDGAKALGNGTVFPLGGKYGALTLQITGITSATITFEVSQDGTNYVAIVGNNIATNAQASTATANGIYQFNVVGIKYFRARVSTYVSGTIYVDGMAVPEALASIPSTSVALTAGTSLVGKVIPSDADGDEKFTTSNPAVVQVSGRIPEYAWFTGADQPIPADQTKFAWGYEFDETTGEISAYGWSGAAWVKVVI